MRISFVLFLKCPFSSTDSVKFGIVVAKGGSLGSLAQFWPGSDGPPGLKHFRAVKVTDSERTWTLKASSLTEHLTAWSHGQVTCRRQADGREVFKPNNGLR